MFYPLYLSLFLSLKPHVSHTSDFDRLLPAEKKEIWPAFQQLYASSMTDTVLNGTAA